MTTMPVEADHRVGDRLRSVAESVYSGPVPANGPGLAARARYALYVVGSALAWTVATLLVVGVLATIFR